MTNLVAKTIVQQINGTDAMAFFAWGSSDLTSFPESDECLGALRFKVRNCRTFKGVAFIKVTLDFNDTYSVELYKNKNLTKSLKEKVLGQDPLKDSDIKNTIDKHVGVYFDQLVDTIDNMLGEVK